MAIQSKPYYTAEQYFELERTSDSKHEYYDGEIFALAGGSENHNLLAANMSGILYNQLRKRPCKFYPSDMRVRIVKTGLYTYPDLSVVCGAVLFDENDPDTLLNPQAIIEILSSSTEKYDRGAKFENYRSIPTLKDYILVSQDKPLIEHYSWQRDNTWLLIVHDNPQSRVIIEAIECTLLLEDVYENIVFASDAA